MKRLAAVITFAAAAIGLSLTVPATRQAWAAAVDLVVGVVGSVLPVDNGKKHALLVGGSDGTNTQLFSTGSAANQGGAQTSNTSILVVPAGDKTVNSTPAVSTQATASTAAGGAGVRHIGTSCSGSISTVAAQTNITLALRDGATGAGTVLWSATTICAINTPCSLSSPPLNALGTAATAMTCEWSAAPVATNFAVASLSFHDAG